MTPTPNPASTSKLVGSSNWHIDNISHRTRLAEDIALLQANFEKLPPSPETTTGLERHKNKEQVNQIGSDKRLAKEIRDFEEAKFHLKQSKLVGNTIQVANSQFRPENVLKADGSNFGNWYCNLAEVACPNLKGPRFFSEECHNLTYKKIGQAVLIASIDPSLVAKMQALPPGEICSHSPGSARAEFYVELEEKI
ncbi:hypothetical protein PTTG_27463 [Puccinia triticina 1-1 BBBD Race 1]|uniref:Uncharacterized protein n=1 Tax=Puccinia triticina (isolate 1-1 / race 1 (BBBD)) TaxID=630390 RepID=A0A180GKR3_PUCT1|nr:hypothetical protein PTTG_27463 [Puccinia triticina 1-1 BBBD Race 1]